MTFTTVLLVCTAGIALCATLVFLVETVVAFWLQESEPVPAPHPRPILVENLAHPLPVDEAA